MIIFYCIDTINQYQNIDFSLCLTENDIKSSEKITELTEYYSFVNEEICKYYDNYINNKFIKRYFKYLII